jgi:teichuronic acid biosynthesis glycosyltransferase TuaG
MSSVSIITPVYNAARWLPETMASVRAQTFTDWEHLLVDDGSTDESMAVVEKIARGDSRIRLLRTPRNMGPSAARNVGIDAARGRFVAFIDSDDIWLPRKLEQSLECILSHGYDFIYHDYRSISPDGTMVGSLIQAPEILNLRSLHTRRGFGCLSIVLDRMRVANFRFPVGCEFLHEDFCALSTLAQQGHIGHRLPEDLARYRLSPQSRSSNKLRSALVISLL